MKYITILTLLFAISSCAHKKSSNHNKCDSNCKYKKISNECDMTKDDQSI